MDNFTVLLGTAICLLVYYACVHFLRISRYFKERGVPYVPTIFPFGSDPKLLLFRSHFAATCKSIYNKFPKEPIVGFFIGTHPFYMIRDLEYNQKVYIQDFSHFVDRGFDIDENVNPLDGHLFFQSGNKWRFLRQKLTPIFTTGKLKWMYLELEKCCNLFLKHFDENVATGEPVNLKEAFSLMSVDAIASCAFGIEPSASVNPESSVFRKVGKEVLEPKLKDGITFFGRIAFPRLLKFLKIETSDKNITDFFNNTISQAFSYRKSTGNSRKDFVQLLLMLKERGVAEIDENDDLEDDNHQMMVNGSVGESSVKFELTDNLLTAQMFVFFIAGYETTSSSLNFLSYLLAHNPDAQNKARDEVRNCVNKYGKITYETLSKMTYLEQCMNESLRMFPPITINFRTCTKPYTFPNGVHLEKGDKVILPVEAMHSDPTYYPDPTEFHPERFDAQIPKCAHAPFGDGPRICIGKRFALLQIKLCIALILLKFSFEPCPLENGKRYYPVELNAVSFVSVPKKPLLVKVKRLES